MNLLDISSPSLSIDTAEEKRVARRGRRFTKAERAEVQRLFLAELATNASMTEACRIAGIDRTLPDYWAEHDEDFAGRFRHAKILADDVIRQELHRRAVLGVERRRTIATSNAAGNIVTIRTETITERSDMLLMFLARARLEEHRRGEGGTWVVDQDSLRVIMDVINRAVTDQETLDRIRAGFAQLAAES